MNVIIIMWSFISVTSKADVKTKGLTIDNNANAGFSVKSAATAEFLAGGTTTVKGAMVVVMIN